MSDDYKEISMKTIEEHYTWIVQDIYLKVNDQKFIKIHSKSNVLDKSDLDKMHKKKLESVYMTIDDYEKFHHKIKEINSENLDPFNLEHALSIAGSFDQVKESAIKMGVDPEVVEKVDKISRSGHELLKTSQKLKSLLELKEKSLSKAHSLLMATIVGPAVLQYPDQSLILNPEKTAQMMVQASFLHNMSLNDDELRESIAGESGKLSPKIKLHPIEASDYANLLKQPPPEMSIIILQHHENCHGNGYPHKLKLSNISPMSTLFILCNRLTDRLISTQCDREAISENMKHLQDYHVQGKNFLMAFEALRNVFQL